jgi:hypothetical protein
MTQQINQLQSKIMRRVYYSFGISIVTSRLFLQAVLLVVGLYGVKVMVHVASFISNLKTVRVSNIDNFIFNAFTHTDVYTLLSVGIVFFALLSFNFDVFKAPRRRMLQSV